MDLGGNSFQTRYYSKPISSTNDYLIYDERKKRVLHAMHLTPAQFNEIWRFHFNELRPDLSVQQYDLFEKDQRLARNVMGYLRHLNSLELEKCWLVEKHTAPERCYQINVNQLKYLHPYLGTPVSRRMYNWEDATKHQNYVNKVMHKIRSYGLDYPLLSNSLNEQEKKQKEDQLVDFFLSEMRKKGKQ